MEKHTAVSSIFALLLVFVLWAWASTMDYDEQVVVEAQIQKDRADEANRLLLDCMNGKAVFSHPNGKRRGFGKTAVVCKGVEEIDV